MLCKVLPRQFLNLQNDGTRPLLTGLTKRYNAVRLKFHVRQMYHEIVPERSRSFKTKRLHQSLRKGAEAIPNGSVILSS